MAKGLQAGDCHTNKALSIRDLATSVADIGIVQTGAPQYGHLRNTRGYDVVKTLQMMNDGVPLVPIVFNETETDKIIRAHMSDRCFLPYDWAVRLGLFDRPDDIDYETIVDILTQPCPFDPEGERLVADTHFMFCVPPSLLGKGVEHIISFFNQSEIDLYCTEYGDALVKSVIFASSVKWCWHLVYRGAVYGTNENTYEDNLRILGKDYNPLSSAITVLLLCLHRIKIGDNLAPFNCYASCAEMVPDRQLPDKKLKHIGVFGHGVNKFSFNEVDSFDISSHTFGMLAGRKLPTP